MSSRSGWDAEKLMQFMAAYQPPVVLAAAMDLDLFGHLATKPCSSGELARRAGFNPRGTRVLLDALAGLDLLEKMTDNTPSPKTWRLCSPPINPAA